MDKQTRGRTGRVRLSASTEDNDAPERFIFNQRCIFCTSCVYMNRFVLRCAREADSLTAVPSDAFGWKVHPNVRLKDG